MDDEMTEDQKAATLKMVERAKALHDAVSTAQAAKASLAVITEAERTAWKVVKSTRAAYEESRADMLKSFGVAEL